MTVLTSGGLTALFVEFIKFVVRKIAKNPELDLPALFYVLAIPIINIFMPFALFWLGISVESPVLAMSWLVLLKFTIMVALASLVSYFGYDAAIKPLKTYSRELKAG